MSFHDLADLLVRIWYSTGNTLGEAAL